MSDHVSHDLSLLLSISLETNNFENAASKLNSVETILLKVLTSLQQYCPWICLASSLTLLRLSFTGLHGKLLDQVFHLPNTKNSKETLTSLVIYQKVVWTLLVVRSYRMQLFWNFTWMARNLTHITHVSLRDNNFCGGLIPDFFVKLQCLCHLDLSLNISTVQFHPQLAT